MCLTVQTCKTKLGDESGEDLSAWRCVGDTKLRCELGEHDRTGVGAAGWMDGWMGNFMTTMETPKMTKIGRYAGFQKQKVSCETRVDQKRKEKKK